MTDAQARIQAASQALAALRYGHRSEDKDVLDFWYGELLDATRAYQAERKQTEANPSRTGEAIRAIVQAEIARSMRPGAPLGGK